jgi:hypothetical protein
VGTLQRNILILKAGCTGLEDAEWRSSNQAQRRTFSPIGLVPLGLEHGDIFLGIPQHSAPIRPGCGNGLATSFRRARRGCGAG